MGDKYWQWVRVEGGEIKEERPRTTWPFGGDKHDLKPARDGGVWVWVGVYATAVACHGRTADNGITWWTLKDGIYWNIFTDPKKFEEANW